MKANRKSIHARLYKFTYSSDLPDNLCPYFWKLVLGVLMFIPNLLLQLPMLIYNSILSLFGKRPYNDCNDRRVYGFIIYFSVIVLFLYSYMNYNWFKAIFNYYSYDCVVANFGWIINGTIIFLILRYFYFKLKPIKHKKQDNIIKEFIKAKYHKYCPKIDWK